MGSIEGLKAVDWLLWNYPDVQRLVAVCLETGRFSPPPLPGLGGVGSRGEPCSEVEESVEEVFKWLEVLRVLGYIVWLLNDSEYDEVYFHYYRLGHTYQTMCDDFRDSGHSRGHSIRNLKREVNYIRERVLELLLQYGVTLQDMEKLYRVIGRNIKR